MVASRVDEEISILRSWRRMPGGYDATAKLVNEEIAKLGDAGTFADLAGIDKKLGLPKGTSWEMGGFADYFAFMGDD
mgnify:CR=1 FL=1|jgi:hypothetical protein